MGVIKKTFFVYIAVLPKNTIHEPHIHFEELKHYLEIALKLTYEETSDANVNEAMMQMQKIFLKGITTCRDFGISDFDWEKYYWIKNLFSVECFYKLVFQNHRSLFCSIT